MQKITVVTLLASLTTLPATSVAVDLNGRWHFGGIGSGGSIVNVTQTGSALTIPVIVPFSGTVGATDADGFTGYSVSWTDGANHAGFGGRIMPSGNLMDGRAAYFIPPNPPEAGGQVVAIRCTCFDNNSVNGDGCDETCQIEPCWSCVGDPSMCTPTVDGGACDDASPCTTGETCTLGVCGGGSPVAPCFDIAGPWTLHSAIPGLDVSSHTMADISQRGSDVRIGGYIGHIDPATGALNVRTANPYYFCGPFDFLTGSVAPDGLTFSLSGSVTEPQPFAPDHCDFFAQTLLGDHCGNGMFEGAEACDDGNLTDGDGCSVICQVEDCYTCGGTPSVCTPVGGGSCDDGESCTVSDVCAGDGSCSGTPDPGAACDDGNPCTSGDTCTGAGTCDGPPTDCGICQSCSSELGCHEDLPGTPCNDGDGCTTGDACFYGECSGAPLTCDLCARCNGNEQCVYEPEPSCKTSTAPDKSMLLIKNHADDSKDRLNWRWNKGTETTLQELGNPPGGENVALCIYDESTATPQLLFRAIALGDDLWTPTAKGFLYKSQTEINDGISFAQLHSGIAGKAKAKMKGKGALMSSGVYPLPAPTLPLPLRVQLQSDNGLCLETTYAASGVIKNDAERGVFKARATP